MGRYDDPLDQFRQSTDFGLASSIDVVALRKRFRLTQRQFADQFGFSAATLRHWENGTRTPTGAALVLLNLIRDNPRAVLLAVRKARQRAKRY